MTRDDEDLIRQLCARATVLMEGSSRIALLPHATTADMFDVLAHQADCRKTRDFSQISLLMDP